MEIAIVGAGRVGLCLAGLIGDSGRYRLRLADSTEDAVSRARAGGYPATELDATSDEALRRWAAGAACLVSAGPDWLAPAVAAAAAAAGCHSLDLAAAGGAPRPSAPGRMALSGCGVSPGLVDDMVLSLIGRFDEPADIVVKVGSLPAERRNRLGYGLIWSVDGLFDEYTRPAEAIVEGEATTLPPLSGHETFELDGVEYESFVTAGGIDALSHRYRGLVRSLSVRTIRYPGHRECIAFLLDDLRLRERRDLFATVLHRGLPAVKDEVLLLVARARGRRAGTLHDEQIVARVSAPDGVSALALASAAHAAALIDRVLSTEAPVPLDRPSADRFEMVASSPYLSRVIRFDRHAGQAPTGP